MSAPNATARLDGRQWVVDDCPYSCGREHRHGAGDAGGDPRALLGHRSAHCDPTRARGDYAAGYVLVDRDERHE